jgi:two-component system sensor histidine kinase YesM
MLLGFSLLFVLSNILIYRGFYLSTMETLRRKIEDSVMIMSDQLAQQIDRTFSQMDTITQIFSLDTKNRELLKTEGLSYIEQIRNYWILEEDLKILGGYFSDYYMAIYLRNDSLMAKDQTRFFGNYPALAGRWKPEDIIKAGGIIWTDGDSVLNVNNTVIPVISHYRMIGRIVENLEDLKFIRASIAKDTVKGFFRMPGNTNPASYYLMDSNGNIALSDSNAPVLESAIFEGMPGYILHNGQKYHILYNRIKTNRWNLVTITPVWYYSRALQSAQLFYLILVLFLFGIFLAVLMAIWKSFDRRVTNISAILSEVEQQNYSKKLLIEQKDELSRIEIRINEFIDRIQLLTGNLIRLEKEKKQSELTALQSQIKPHFIYNTLDSINWMALDKGNYEVSRAIVELAEFLRKGLSPDSERVSIRDELEYTELYIRIMNARSDCKVRLETAIDEEVLSCPIIKFLLQPIVENSIIHGFYKNKRPDGIIGISGRLDESGFVVIIINDNGGGFEPLPADLSRKTRGGYGLRNVEYRLRLFYGDESGLAITGKKGSGTEVRIKWRNTESPD